MIIRFLALLLVFATCPAQAFAAHAIAMQGEPKYAATATHLDYANPDAPKGGTLTQAALGTFDTLNPFNIKGKAATGLDYVYDRLAARVWDEPFSLYGLVAQDIAVPDDRSSVTFTLNPAAIFHDGVGITAKDVKFSYETLKKYGRPNMRRVYGLVDKVTIVDQRTIRFDLGKGHDRETVMILSMMPVLPEHWWKDKTFDATTLAIAPGSGPYKIASVNPGRRIVYERVADDWAKGNITRIGHNNFDRLVFDYYRDDSVAMEAFRAHGYDMRREFDPARWHAGYSDFPKDVLRENLPHGRPEWVRGLIFNMRRAPFDDIKVREALTLAFDFEWMNKSLFYGQAKHITSTFPNTPLAAPESDLLKTSRRNALREADALLKLAGWIVKDGARVSLADGTPLTFTILLSSPQDEKIALGYARALARLGITAKVRTVDAAQFTGNLAAYDYDMVMHYWINSLSPGTEQLIYWGCEAARTQGSKNYAGLCDAGVDDAAAAIAHAKTREELVAGARVLDKQVMNLHPFIPLYYLGQDYFARWKGIGRPLTTPLYGAVIETWWRQP